MSLLYLVRHGQASFFAENYDRLSPLGELQARRLGEFFAARGVRFDAVYSGPAVRQQRTAEIIAATMTDLGCPCPAPAVVAGLNEHSGDKLLSAPHARAFFERHPELGALAKAFRDAREPDDVQKNFQKLFEAAVRRWTDGELTVPGVELWEEFHDAGPRRDRVDHLASRAGPDDPGGLLRRADHGCLADGAQDVDPGQPRPGLAAAERLGDDVPLHAGPHHARRFQLRRASGKSGGDHVPLASRNDESDEYDSA